MCSRGFTLIEILTAVIIVAILAVMAVPLYEKTIERSHLAEARTLMNRLQEAKLAAMDTMGCDTYDASSSTCPKLQHLGMAFVNPGENTSATGTTFSTKYFTYSLTPGGGFVNGICAKRTGGDYTDTVFVYLQGPSGGEFGCSGSHCDDYGYGSSEITCNFE